MNELRLGVYQLPKPEAGLVRALLSLLTVDCTERRWRVVDEGPFDAVVVDSTFAHDSRLSTMAPSILSIAPQGATAAPDTLLRPIRADQLSAWLEAAQARLHGGAPRQSAPAQPVADPARYRLRRWPPSEALHGDPLRQRMAALLARRPMNALELAAAVQAPAERCHAFLQTLRSLAVLAPVQVLATPAPPRPAAPAAVDTRRTLVQSLRRRLGL